MSGNLLDTNAVIFALTFPEKLSAAARRAILRGPNVLSVVSYWEVILKSMKGLWRWETCEIGGRTRLRCLRQHPCILRPEHIAEMLPLPLHHKDPFDRILIAQARTENLALITSDKDIARYASKELKVIR